MKILLDECVPVQVRSALVGNEVHSATEKPWRGLSNGELLTLAEKEDFDLIIVADKNLRDQIPAVGEMRLVHQEKFQAASLEKRPKVVLGFPGESQEIEALGENRPRRDQ